MAGVANRAHRCKRSNNSTTTFTKPILLSSAIRRDPPACRALTVTRLWRRLRPLIRPWQHSYERKRTEPVLWKATSQTSQQIRLDKWQLFRQQTRWEAAPWASLRPRYLTVLPFSRHLNHLRTWIVCSWPLLPQTTTGLMAKPATASDRNSLPRAWASTTINRPRKNASGAASA